MMFKYTVFGIMALILPFWIGWTARRSELGGKGGWRKWRNLLGQAVFVGFVVLLVFNLMYRFSGTGMPIGSMLETFDSSSETGTTRTSPVHRFVRRASMRRRSVSQPGAPVHRACGSRLVLMWTA